MFLIHFIFLSLCLSWIFPQTNILATIPDPYLETSPPSHPELTMPVTVEFLFNKNFTPDPKGQLVVGIYSDKETYDLITVLDLKDIHQSNSKITKKMWNNYYRLVIPFNGQGSHLHKLNLEPGLDYAITVFYDRNQNREFNFFIYPAENYGFSNYKKNFTWRKPYFEEISFSPRDYQDNRMLIKMKP